MSDLMDRLRKVECVPGRYDNLKYPRNPDGEEAAEEITRLRQENEALQAQVAVMRETVECFRSYLQEAYNNVSDGDEEHRLIQMGMSNLSDTAATAEAHDQRVREEFVRHAIQRIQDGKRVEDPDYGSVVVSFDEDELIELLRQLAWEFQS